MSGNYRSYPRGAHFTDQPATAEPIVAVDVDWVAAHGGRAQRRRIERELRRQAKPRQIKKAR